MKEKIDDRLVAEIVPRKNGDMPEDHIYKYFDGLLTSNKTASPVEIKSLQESFNLYLKNSKLN